MYQISWYHYKNANFVIDRKKVNWLLNLAVLFQRLHIHKHWDDVVRTLKWRCVRINKFVIFYLRCDAEQEFESEKSPIFVDFNNMQLFKIWTIDLLSLDKKYTSMEHF